MSILSRKAFFWILTVGIGVLLGYWLTLPVISIPPELIVNVLKPLLLKVSELFNNSDAFLFSLKIAIAFLVDLPNTLLVVFATFICIRILRRARLIIYSALLWPLAIHFAYWLEIWILRGYLTEMSLPSSVGSSRPDFWYSFSSSHIFVTFSFFVALTFFLNHRFNKSGRLSQPPLESKLATPGMPNVG